LVTTLKITHHLKTNKPNGAQAPTFLIKRRNKVTLELIREAYWQSMKAFLLAEVDSYTDWHPVFGIL
jgi:hypothetical protein